MSVGSLDELKIFYKAKRGLISLITGIDTRSKLKDRQSQTTER